jgi:mevalonate kinase
MAKLNVLSRKIIIEQMEKITSELLEFMMNSNIEMKLGQLLDICFQILKMMTKSLLKMEEALIANVCK